MYFLWHQLQFQCSPHLCFSFAMEATLTLKCFFPTQGSFYNRSHVSPLSRGLPTFKSPSLSRQTRLQQEHHCVDSSLQITQPRIVWCTFFVLVYVGISTRSLPSSLAPGVSALFRMVWMKKVVTRVIWFFWKSHLLENFLNSKILDLRKKVFKISK